VGSVHVKSSSPSRVETVKPVTRRKTPTPPMQPTRMWRGKKPMSEPRRRKPSRKNEMPV
jgi:hypothetical protein